MIASRAVLLSAMCFACAEPIGEHTAAIVRGTSSDVGQNAVVLIMQGDPDVDGRPLCTGTLLAPTLVLTARHCVARTDANASCSSDGTADSGGVIYGDVDPSTLYVYAGRTRPDFIAGTDDVARGTSIASDGSDNLCDHDIALLHLERALPIGIAPVRLDETTRIGEALTLVGWGATETELEPAVRQQRGSVAVLDLGPATQLGPSELSASEGPCFGDSGGPALALSGAVVGVASRVIGGSFGEGELCVDSVGIYTELAGHRDLILAGYASVGQDPWLEGQPSPLRGPFGAWCSTGLECESGLCHEGLCTQECAAAACPDGFSCADADGVMVCAADEVPACSIARSPHGSIAAPSMLLIAVVLRVRLGRARRRTVNRR